MFGWQAVRPKRRRALVHGVADIVRTFLSFALEIEMDGVVPWRRAETRRRDVDPKEGDRQ
jgi:hypothetical protein